MHERLHSGVPGLDQVLGGGFPMNAINLIVGLPGTGKTLLAQQYMFANATAERQAAYLSTVSEPFEKIVRYGQELDFFDTDAVGGHVRYEDLGDVLLSHGLSAVLERVHEILDQRKPALVVIDSFRPFATFADSRLEYLRFLHELTVQLTIRPVTCLWLGEYAVADIAGAPEFAVADAVILLTAGRYEQREVRLLQVLKLRGSGFSPGRHSYRLSAAGMRVFPRLADSAALRRYELADRWVSSGVRGLDALLGQGYRAGSSTLVVGPSGVGKTVLGLQFAFEGAREGTGTTFATFEENPSQLAATAAAFGWSFEAAGVQLLYRSAVDLHLDEWVYELLELVDVGGSRRVCIDGLYSLRAAAQDQTRFEEYLYSLVQRFARAGVTLMMSVESPDLFGSARVTDQPLSHMADNVLLLNFVRRDAEYRRAITVLKSRAAAAHPRVTEYTIGSMGIALHSPRPRAAAR